MQFFKRLFNDRSGATAIEYGLIAALIAVALLAIFGNTETTVTADDVSMKVTESASLGDE